MMKRLERLGYLLSMGSPFIAAASGSSRVAFWSVTVGGIGILLLAGTALYGIHKLTRKP